MSYLRIFIFALIYCVPISFFAQNSDTLEYKYESYLLRAVYDSSKFCSDLIISKDKSVVYKEECLDYRISSIFADDLEGSGKKYVFIETYSGGAHCCTYLLSAELKDDKFSYIDSIWWGNSGYNIKDINNDGRKEILGYNDMFAYAFTNFAQSAFSIAIYTFKNGKFHFANKEFADEVIAHIKELKTDLKDYIKTGFDCPRGENDDTFNTDAGAVKAILAPIVADYQSIGRTDEGYDYVKKIYKCPDRDKFIKILKTDYKLK